MINVTEQAIQWFKSLKKENNNYLLITLKSSGCNGFKYELSWIDKLYDNVEYTLTDISDDKDSVVVAYPSLFKDKLDDITLDLIQDGLNKRVEIINPHVKNECGCGESIGF